MRRLNTQAERMVASDPEHQTVELGIRITLTSRCNALRTSVIGGVAGTEPENAPAFAPPPPNGSI